jgi:hypothetical protein
MSIDDLIAKWESTAKYHRKCYMQTSQHVPIITSVDTRESLDGLTKIVGRVSSPPMTRIEQEPTPQRIKCNSCRAEMWDSDPRCANCGDSQEDYGAP